MPNKLIAALLALLVYIPLAFAADSDVGIVLLHGKWDRPPTNVQGLARQLEAQGFQVATPDMPWSAIREYDVSYSQALDYAGSGRPVDALFILSPGHTPYAGRMRAALAGSVAKATDMIKSGAENDKAWFDDFNQGTTKQVRAKAGSYFSYFDPEGLAAMPKSAAAISTAIPVFMAVGSSDPIAAVAEETIFARAQKHPKSVFSVVNADHIGLATSISPALTAWLKALTF